MPLGGGPIVLRMCVENRIQPMAREVEVPGRNASIKQIADDILPRENQHPAFLLSSLVGSERKGSGSHAPPFTGDHTN